MRAIAIGILLAVSLTACGQGSQGEQEQPPSAAAQLSAEAQATTFETWELLGQAQVRDAGAQAPTGENAADVLSLGNGDGVAYTDSTPGRTIRGSVTLWSPTDALVSLQLVNWCRAGSTEVTTVPVALTREPQEYSAELQVARPEDCVRFQIIRTDVNRGDINAWNPQLQRQ